MRRHRFVTGYSRLSIKSIDFAVHVILPSPRIEGDTVHDQR
jgi:hypothetical protein